MRKVVVSSLLLLALAALPVAAVDMGLGFLFNYTMLTDGGARRLDVESFSDVAHIGLFLDVPLTGRIGLRLDGAVKFAEIPADEVQVIYDKNIHWDGAIGPTLHLFGKTAIDPYLQFGAGCAGGVFFDRNWDSWQTRTQITIFLHASAGINVVIARALLLGAKIRVTPYWFNPSPLVTYPQLPVAANLFVGFRV
jgi:hypothetical protein